MGFQLGMATYTPLAAYGIEAQTPLNRGPKSHQRDGYSLLLLWLSTGHRWGEMALPLRRSLLQQTLPGAGLGQSQTNLRLALATPGPKAVGATSIGKADFGLFGCCQRCALNAQ